MNRIAVLLTCHNRREKTLYCLQHLFSCDLPDNYTLNVFLVDDGSTDETAKHVKERFPMVTIITGDGNLFWNRGMYLAWKTASKEKDFEFYLWLNDDTYLFKSALRVMLSASGSSENKAIIVAATCSQKTGKLTYSGFRDNGEMIHPNNELQETATFNGNLVLIPKYVYQKVGNLDPYFHHSIGDMDYGKRAQSKGIKSYIAPIFLAYCEEHDTSPKWCLKELDFHERIQSLYSPLGNCHPLYFFHYEFRHFGILIAIKHFLSIHLRVAFPSLWK